MLEKCMELTAYEAQYRMPWIVFDRDQVKDFDEIIHAAREKGIGVRITRLPVLSSLATLNPP